MLARSSHYNSSKSILSGRVGHIVLARRAAMRVRDAFDMQMARSLLNEELEPGDKLVKAGAAVS